MSWTQIFETDDAKWDRFKKEQSGYASKIDTNTHFQDSQGKLRVIETILDQFDNPEGQLKNISGFVRSADLQEQIIEDLKEQIADIQERYDNATDPDEKARIAKEYDALQETVAERFKKDLSDIDNWPSEDSVSLIRNIAYAGHNSGVEDVPEGVIDKTRAMLEKEGVIDKLREQGYSQVFIDDIISGVAKASIDSANEVQKIQDDFNFDRTDSNSIINFYTDIEKRREAIDNYREEYALESASSAEIEALDDFDLDDSIAFQEEERIQMEEEQAIEYANNQPTIELDSDNQILNNSVPKIGMDA